MYLVHSYMLNKPSLHLVAYKVYLTGCLVKIHIQYLMSTKNLLPLQMISPAYLPG